MYIADWGLVEKFKYKWKQFIPGIYLLQIKRWCVDINYITKTDKCIVVNFLKKLFASFKLFFQIFIFKLYDNLNPITSRNIQLIRISCYITHDLDMCKNWSKFETSNLALKNDRFISYFQNLERYLDILIRYQLNKQAR